MAFYDFYPLILRSGKLSYFLCSIFYIFIAFLRRMVSSVNRSSRFPVFRLEMGGPAVGCDRSER
jgi:hypothetical protein